MKGIEIHPAAELFPMMGTDELRALADDIKAHGLQEWCVLYQGKLLDGRNRWRACELVGVEPETCERDDEPGFDPIAYVISHNLHRRHLNESQRATVAAKLKKMLQPEAEKKKKTGKSADGAAGGRGKKKNLVENLPQGNGRTRDQAAALLNVSGKSVDHATTVLEQGSNELVQAVERGEVAVSKAAKIAKTTDKKQQLAAATEKPKHEPQTAFEHLKHWWGKANEMQRTLFRDYITH